MSWSAHLECWMRWARALPPTKPGQRAMNIWRQAAKPGKRQGNLRTGSTDKEDGRHVFFGVQVMRRERWYSRGGCILCRPMAFIGR